MIPKRIKEPKNLHAITLFRSWLDALAIDNEKSDIYDITVQDKDRNPVEVRIQIDPQDTLPNVITLNAKDLTGEDIGGAKEVFKSFVEQLGFEYIDPVGRGEVPEFKISSKDDFESVYLRHRDILRSPNVDKDQILFYSKTIRNVSNYVYRKNATFFKSVQIDEEDLRSIAMTHVLVFINQYQLPQDMDNDDNNLKKCHVFLTQRLYFYKALLLKKAKSFSSTTETWWMPQIEIDLDYVTRHNQFKASKTDSRRKQEAKEMLDKELGSLSHDDRLYILDLAAKSTYIDPAAANLANKMLGQHYLGCSLCLAAQKGEDKVSMNLGG